MGREGETSGAGDLGALQAAARAWLDPSTYDYFAGGAGREQSLRAAAGGWASVGLRPRVLRDVGAVSTATTVLGAALAAPLLGAPMASLRLLHPDGERAWTAGLAQAGCGAVLSSRTSTAIAEATGANAATAPWWFQVYVLHDRAITRELVERAVAAGAGALVLTGDAPRIPPRAREPRPELRPGWLLPDLADRSRPDSPGTRQDPATTFADVEWLRSVSGGLPVLVKGVLRADDARACLAAGAAGMVVSNHGGRQLDGAVATARALPEVVAAVGDAGEVLVDGGIRSGVDVLRALALGARAVLVGRPCAWALATGGADGVRALAGRLTRETEDALALAGCVSPAEVAAADLAAPG